VEDDAVKELRQELNELKQARAADFLVAARMAARQPAPNPEAAQKEALLQHEGETTDPESTSEEEQAEAGRKATAAVLAHLDRTFTSENADSRWAGPAANDAVRAISGSLPDGSQLSEVNCRATLCRIATTHHSMEAFRAYNEAAFGKPERMPWNGGVYSAVREQSSGGIVAVAFLAKDGLGLPFEHTLEE
jgi:hypothetical protein